MSHPGFDVSAANNIREPTGPTSQPETVAEHSFRVGIIGMALAPLEGADIGRTAVMRLLHDAHETRIGDVPSGGRTYVTVAAPKPCLLTRPQACRM